MINSLLLSALICTSPTDGIESCFFPIPLGRPVTHLHTFFDTRTFSAGDACFLESDALMPRLHWSMPNESTVPSLITVPLRLNSSPKPAKTDNDKSSGFDSVLVALMPSLPWVEPENDLLASLAKANSKHPASVVMAASVSRPKTEAYETVESKPPTKPEDTVIPSINAKAPLSEVLEMIRKKTTININLLGDGTKPIQITDKDVKLGVLIANICAIAGYSHLKVGNAIEIGPDDTLKNAFPEEYAAAHATPAVPEVVEPQDNETKVYHTNYLDAKKLVDAISKNYTPKGLLMYMSPETPSPTLDSGISASASTGAQSSSTLGTDDISKMSRIIILTGPTKAVEGAIDLFKALDVQPAQVSIQVEVHDISENGAKQLGATWTLPTETFTENTPSGIALSDYARSPLSFSAQLNALETKGEDKLLARPNISVDDGQRGYVLVGDRLQYPILTGYSQTGSAIFSTQQENVGIYLQVSAWITNDGKVKLKLYPQVSTVTGFTSIAGSQYPNISTRESQSTVTIDSGKTFVIAGLIQDEDIKNVQGIPILDQLPFFKELFTFRSKTHTRNEVLITITPTITNHS